MVMGRDQVSHRQGAKGRAAGPDMVWTTRTAQKSEARPSRKDEGEPQTPGLELQTWYTEAAMNG